MKKQKLFISILTVFFVCFMGVAFSGCGEEHAHSYTQQITTQATCTEKGVITYTCSCNDTYTEEIPALGHEFTNYVSDNNATYEKDGTKTATCNRGCGKTDTVTDVGSMLVKNTLRFKTLKVNGDEVTGDSLSNTTETFSFIEEIQVNGNAKFIVAKDKYGAQTYLTKIVPLEEGDNVFYVFQMEKDEITKTYTVTLRRRPIYIVSFDTNGGTAISSQTVEEGFTATIPQEIPQAYGKKFVKWNFDFFTPITKSIDISAEWMTTIYSIKYDLNGGAMGYTQKNEPIPPTRKIYVHGTAVPLETPTRYGYDFIGWYDGENCITEISATTYGDKLLTAVWECAFTYIIHEKNVDTGDHNLINPTKHFGTITGVTDYGKQKYPTAMSVPERIDDVKITKIATNTFYNLTDLQDVYIHGEIQANAFVGCTALQNVYTYLTLINPDNSNLFSATIYDYIQFSKPFPNANCWYDINNDVPRYVFLRLDELLNIWQTLKQNSPTSQVSAIDVREAIKTHTCSTNYKCAVASEEERKTWTEDDYRKMLLADYELALQLFEEELNRDFIIATGAFDMFSAPYNEWKEDMNEIFCFFLYEGCITPKYQVVADKYNQSIIVGFENTELLELYSTKETAIAFVYNDIISTRFDEIISFWETANNLIDVYKKAYVEVMKKDGFQFRWNDQIVVTQKVVLDYKSVLILERNDNESDEIKNILEEDGYQTFVLNILKDEIPLTWEKLSFYDQVILVNIANADMPEGFDEILHEYVYYLGGSMLTVGGSQIDQEGNVVANAYNREDMYGTLYQEMLPVQAIDYTPPIGVMIIIDRSASMESSSSASGQTNLELAKQGAKSCLDALSDRDYCGIMTLEEKYTEVAPVLPMTQRAKLEKAIDDIVSGGGSTEFEDALRGAAEGLQALRNVERRHVILVTDGVPADSYDQYSRPIFQYVNDVNAKVTFSFVIIGEDISSADKDELCDAAELGEGRFYDVDVNRLVIYMREELMMPEIKEINIETFVPTIASNTSIVSGINQADIPELEGFYGTKLKDGATATLTGLYDVPIYADWNYGNGKVGSFMCDLNMVWSQSFMKDATGQQLILNIVYSLME